MGIKKHLSGFTLTEMLVVTAIVAAFAAMAIPDIMKLNQNSKEIECLYRRRIVESAKASYVIDFGGDPMVLVGANTNSLNWYLPGPAIIYTVCPLSAPETTAVNTYGKVYDLYRETTCPNHANTSTLRPSW